MTIKRLDKPTVRLLREELEAAVAAVLTKRGMAGTLGTMTFSAGDVSCRFKARILEPAAGTVTEAKRAWDRNCFKYGFKPSDHGKIVTLGEKQFRIDSLRKKAFGNTPKQPVRLEYVGNPGKFVVASMGMVAAALGSAK